MCPSLQQGAHPLPPATRKRHEEGGCSASARTCVGFSKTGGPMYSPKRGPQKWKPTHVLGPISHEISDHPDSIGVDL